MKKDTLYATLSMGSGSPMLQAQPPRAFQPAATKDAWTLVVDPEKTFQPMLGMGGTWTDTDVYALLRMDPEQQDAALHALFDPETGAGWNFMRLPFGSTDWEATSDYYTYDDMPRGEMDWDLSHFSIQRDIDRGLFRLALRCKAINPDMVFLGSVWGVPGWMKENHAIMYGRFNPACTEVYARYLRKTVEAYREQGVELLAVTPQNESLTSDDRATPACRFTWRLQKDVVVALRREFEQHDIDTQIWVYDHNFDMARAFVEPMLADEEARAALDAVAFHDYGGSPEEMGRLAAMYPDVPFYMTERHIASVANMDNFVQELRNGARSYLQWTTMTDEYGGPHQYRGDPFVYEKPHPMERLAALYNLKEDANRWFKSPSYGLYGQFTKFLHRGMVRCDSTAGHPGWVTSVAFKDRQDGRLAVVVVNQTEEEQSFTLRVGGGEVGVSQPAQSVATYEVTPGELLSDGACAVCEAPAQTPPKPLAFDLEPQEIYLNGPAVAGEELLLSCRVRNVGNAPTPEDMTAIVQFSEDGDCLIARGALRCPVLQPGEDVVVEANIPYGLKVTWTAEAGYHNLFAYVSAGNCYPERNRNNNRLGVEIYFEA